MTLKTFLLNFHEKSLDSITYPNTLNLLQESTPIIKIRNDEYIIFSGLTNNHEPSNDLWHYNGVNWNILVPKGGYQPKPRWKHVVFWKETCFIYIYGGITQEQDIIWEFDINLRLWRSISPIKIINEDNTDKNDSFQNFGRKIINPYRYDFGGFIYQNSLWIFGGLNKAQECLNDIWKFDINEKIWEKVEILDKAPSARYGFGYCTDINQNFWIYGGRPFNNELWRFNPSTLKWSQIKWKDIFPEQVYRPKMYSLYELNPLNENKSPTIVVERGTNNYYSESNQIWSIQFYKKSLNNFNQDIKTDIVTDKPITLLNNINNNDESSKFKINLIEEDNVDYILPTLKIVELESENLNSPSFEEENISSLMDSPEKENDSKLNDKISFESILNENEYSELNDNIINSKDLNITQLSEEEPRNPINIIPTPLQVNLFHNINIQSENDSKLIEDSSNNSLIENSISSQNNHTASITIEDRNIEKESINLIDSKVEAIGFELKNLKSETLNIVKKIDNLSILGEKQNVKSKDKEAIKMKIFFENLQENFQKIFETLDKASKENKEKQEVYETQLLELQKIIQNESNQPAMITQSVQIEVNSRSQNIQTDEDNTQRDLIEANIKDFYIKILNSSQIEKDELIKNQEILLKENLQMKEKILKYQEMLHLLNIKVENNEFIIKEYEGMKSKLNDFQKIETDFRNTFEITLKKKDGEISSLVKTVSKLQEQIQKFNREIELSNNHVKTLEKERNFFRKEYENIISSRYSNINLFNDVNIKYSNIQKDHLFTIEDNSKNSQIELSPSSRNKDIYSILDNNKKNLNQQKKENEKSSLIDLSTESYQEELLSNYPEDLFEKHVIQYPNQAQGNNDFTKLYDSTSKYYCMTVKSFISNSPTHLSFEAGDLLEFISSKNEIECECILNGKKGIVYRSYIDSPEKISEM